VATDDIKIHLYDCKTVEEILHYNQIPKLTEFVEDRQNGTGQANRVCSDCITRISDC